MTRQLKYSVKSPDPVIRVHKSRFDVKSPEISFKSTASDPNVLCNQMISIPLHVCGPVICHPKKLKKSLPDIRQESGAKIDATVDDRTKLHFYIMGNRGSLNIAYQWLMRNVHPKNSETIKLLDVTDQYILNLKEGKNLKKIFHNMKNRSRDFERPKSYQIDSREAKAISVCFEKEKHKSDYQIFFK